jgi:hypothetical protein
MAEPADAGTDSRVRDYIHGEICDQVERWVNNALADGDPKFARYARRSWQGRIDALYEGRAVLVSRFELPDWHPMNPKYGGDPADHFELGEDDVLRPHEGPKLKLNRAQRRAAGWRGNGLNGDGH